MVIIVGFRRIFSRRASGGFFHGVAKSIFLGGNSGKISFHRLETKRKNIFLLNRYKERVKFQTPRGHGSPPPSDAYGNHTSYLVIFLLPEQSPKSNKQLKQLCWKETFSKCD